MFTSDRILDSSCDHRGLTIESNGKEVCEDCGECLDRNLFTGKDRTFAPTKSTTAVSTNMPSRVGKWHSWDPKSLNQRQRRDQLVETAISSLRSLYETNQCPLDVTRQAIRLLDEYYLEARPSSLPISLLLACVYGAYRLEGVVQTKPAVCLLMPKGANKSLVTRKKLSRAYTLLLRNTPNVPELKNPMEVKNSNGS